MSSWCGRVSGICTHLKEVEVQGQSLLGISRQDKEFGSASLSFSKVLVFIYLC